MRPRVFVIVGSIVAVLGATSAGLLLRRHHIRRPDPFEASHIRDQGAVLGSFGPLLEELADAWDEELGIEVQIVTLRSADEPLAVLAKREMTDRQIGANSPAGGVLFVLACAQHAAHIQVTPALDEAFPAALLEQLAARQLAPYAGSGAVGMAFMDVMHHLKDHAFARVLAGERNFPSTVRQRPAFRRALHELAEGIGADVEVSSAVVLRDLRVAVAKKDRERYAPSADPLESAERFLLVLRDLAGDPTLPLFTPGSQVQRARYAVAPFAYWKQRQLVQISRPLRVIRRGDRAVVGSRKPTRGFVPILLRRSEGLWRVDLVETWKNVFFDEHGNYVVANRNNPYMFGLGALRQRGRYELEPIDLHGHSLAALISDLERELALRDDPELHFRLAELLFRNCFAAVDALAHYEMAARAAPEVSRYVSTMAERAMYLGLFGYAIPFYEALGASGYERLGDAHFALSDYREAERYYQRALRSGPSSRRIERRLESARRMRMEAES